MTDHKAALEDAQEIAGQHHVPYSKQVRGIAAAYLDLSDRVAMVRALAKANPKGQYEERSYSAGYSRGIAAALALIDRKDRL